MEEYIPKHGSPEWADEFLGYERDPVDGKLYHCPRCGHDHEEMLCFQTTYWDNPDKDDRENGKPFVPTSVVECKSGEWERCSGCSGWCRKTDLKNETSWDNREIGNCPSCSMGHYNLKCNGCQIVRFSHDSNFERIKRAPYVQVWECWVCKSRDISITDEEEPLNSKVLAKNDDPLNELCGAPKGYTIIDVDKTIKQGDIHWWGGKWKELGSRFGQKVTELGNPVARKRDEYSRDHDK